MVEGPGVHRVAIAHRKLLLGQKFIASSPNGKFKDGAAAINGQILALIEAHGKNIFYFFTCCKPSKENTLETLPENAVVVHIHFGMSGSFRTFPVPGPEPRPATRLRLIAETVGVVAHLSASVCSYGSLDLYRKKIECLGPDPLRSDSNKELVWANLQKSKKKIGALLMEQSIIAGIGNIYRTELLFVIGVHPDYPASSLARSMFEQMWSEAQRLLQVGVLTGSIITVSQDEAGSTKRLLASENLYDTSIDQLVMHQDRAPVISFLASFDGSGKPFSKLRKGEKRYIYNHKHCRRCHGVVQSWKLAQRTVYACEVCQPLPAGASSSSEVPESVKHFQKDAAKDHDERFTQYIVIDKYSDQLKATQTSSQVARDQVKCKIGQQRRRTVEHQALKDITTGGLLVDSGFQNDDAILQGLAPTTPQKPLSAEGTRKIRKRKRVILAEEGGS